jgi:hypothetical protein
MKKLKIKKDRLIRATSLSFVNATGEPVIVIDNPTEDEIRQLQACPPGERMNLLRIIEVERKLDGYKGNTLLTAQQAVALGYAEIIPDDPPCHSSIVTNMNRTIPIALTWSDEDNK